MRLIEGESKHIEYRFMMVVDGLKDKKVGFTMEVGRDGSSTLRKLEYAFCREYVDDCSEYLTSRMNDRPEQRGA